MDMNKVFAYSSLATQAIMNTLSSGGDQDGVIEKACEHMYDDLFQQVLNGVADGMGLRIIRIDPLFGLLIGAKKGKSPYVANLTWLNRNLGIEATTDKKELKRQELRMIGSLVLVTIISELFPSPDTLRPDWDSSCYVTPQSAINSLNQLAQELVNNEDEEAKAHATVAQMIIEERLPRMSREPGTLNSSVRSQEEMALKWIRLMHDHGLLVEDRGVEETKWFASQSFKAFIKDVGILPLVETINELAKQKEEPSLAHEEMLVAE